MAMGWTEELAQILCQELQGLSDRGKKPVDLFCLFVSESGQAKWGLETRYLWWGLESSRQQGLTSFHVNACGAKHVIY